MKHHKTKSLKQTIWQMPHEPQLSLGVYSVRHARWHIKDVPKIDSITSESCSLYVNNETHGFRVIGF